MTELACGNCVYYAMWHRFPPTASWVVLIPLWYLALSTIRTFSSTKLMAVMPLYLAVPLILIIFLFAPGIIGPPLGFWIPVCILVGTISGFRNERPHLRQGVIVLSLVFAVLLLAFGTWDAIEYRRMPEARKAQLRPDWEMSRPPK